jgi:hypothetical protein
VFVVARDRSIVWKQVGENMTDRASPSEILAKVRTAAVAADHTTVDFRLSRW